MQIRTLTLLVAGFVFLFSAGHIVLAGRPVVQQNAANNISAELQNAAMTEAGKPAVYSLNDVAGHGSRDSCWTAINGSVYDLTSFIYRHPGGAARITSICGIDGSALFNRQHGHSRMAQAMLSLLKIGTLK